MSAAVPLAVRHDYTRGPIWGGLARLSAPIFAELLSWNVDTLLEVYWVGRLGADALAAMGLAFMVLIVVRAVGMGIRVAGHALVAQRVGAGDAEGAALLGGQCIALQTLTFLPLGAAGWFLAPAAVGLLGPGPAVAGLAVSYLRAGFVMLLFIDGIFTLANIFRGAGEPRFSLCGMIVNTAAAMVAMPALIFGAGPLPALGIAGALVGLGAGRLAGAAVMLGVLFSGRSRLPMRPAHLRPRAAALREIVSLGWPATGQMFFERGANVVLVGMVAPFGPLALAAWGVGARVSNMARMPGYSLQAAVRTLVGQNIGARRLERAWAAAWSALGTVALAMAAVAALLFLRAEEVVGFFGMEGAALVAGAFCLRVLSLGVGFEAARRVVAGIFEGAGSTKPPMLVEAVVRWAVLLPGAYLAADVLGWREGGIWWAVAGSQLLGGAVLFAWFALGWRRRISAGPAGPAREAGVFPAASPGGP